jgi:hypothetical protein
MHPPVWRSVRALRQMQHAAAVGAGVRRVRKSPLTEEESRRDLSFGSRLTLVKRRPELRGALWHGPAGLTLVRRRTEEARWLAVRVLGPWAGGPTCGPERPDLG